MANPTSARPTIIVVLGMHRSGTSVTTNLLSAFGVPLSDDLMEPTEFNAKGYFESKQISKIHDRILMTMGMDWHTSSVTVAFPRDWWRALQVQSLKAELAAIASEELARNNNLWGFKDPRTARLLPVWLEIIDELGLDAKFILCSRDPNEVAQSLFSRERIDPMHAELMWLEHNADAISNLHGKVDAIVEYGKWIDEPIEQARYMLKAIGRPWTGSGEELERIVREVVSPDLRHHSVENAGFRLPFTGPMYDLLKRRDVAQLTGLAEIFNVSKGFAHVLLSSFRDVTNAEIQEWKTLAQQRGAQIEELQRQLGGAVP